MSPLEYIFCLINITYNKIFNNALIVYWILLEVQEKEQLY